MKHYRVPRRAVALLAPLVVFATACTAASDADTARDDDGAVTEEGQVGVFSLREGDCVRLPSSLRNATEPTDGFVDEVADFETVPCSEPHDGEVFLGWEEDPRGILSHLAELAQRDAVTPRIPHITARSSQNLDPNVFGTISRGNPSSQRWPVATHTLNEPRQFRIPRGSSSRPKYGYDFVGTKNQTPGSACNDLECHSNRRRVLHSDPAGTGDARLPDNFDEQTGAMRVTERARLPGVVPTSLGTLQ